MRAAGLVALLVIAVAPAGAETARGLHDARYCEIIELRGSLPDMTAVVWNTVTFNDCPADWWEAFDAGALAEELGATGVVLNGPRHFLMDSAAARPGRVREFHGERMSKVATISLHTVADLSQTPYTARTIERKNSWRWKAGRTVFELVSPEGDKYVMQSYSQIKDPSLDRGDLPQLGNRLELPDGWRYRKRKLERELVLQAKGEATILQDDLQNTYQLRR